LIFVRIDVSDSCVTYLISLYWHFYSKLK